MPAETAPLAATVKYNPHLWGPDELRAIFVVRTRELAELLEHLKATPPGATPQHILITGARGMGKSTLLQRLALAVEDDAELSGQWIALTFPEEQYTVGNLAELWRNVLDALADTLERHGAPAAELARLDADIGRIGTLPPAERETAALDCLNQWIAQQQRRRLLLLIDSTDLLFANLAGGEAGGAASPLWRLRKTLTHQSGIFWLGASYQALESSHRYDDAFMDFFQLLELRPLKLEEMRAALLALARTFGAGRGLAGDAAATEMARTLDAHPERLKALRTMTGGNPRTTAMLYELFAAGGQDDIHSDLRRLLDTMTPLYKARMESLSEQACKLLAHVMEHWAPVSARQLGEIAGIATGTVSGQLSRLEAEGLIEKTALPSGKRAGFQASERLFNIWYLMRYAPRRLRQRLTWLVEFMRLWYSGDELCQLARHRAAQHRSGRLRDSSQLEYSRAMGLAMPEDADARYQLEHAVFNAARVIDQTRQALAELFELDGEDSEFTTAEDYLQRFHGLDQLLGECPKLGEGERNQYLSALKSSVVLGLAEKELIARSKTKPGKSACRQFLKLCKNGRNYWENRFGAEATNCVYEAAEHGNFFPDCPDSKLAYGQIMACFGEDAMAFAFALELLEKAHRDDWLEKAYRHAIKLAPKSYLWNNLGFLLMNDLGRPQEAEAAYRQAIALDPKYARSWNDLGDLLADYLGRFQEAETAYHQAIALAPKDASPWNDLGILLTRHLGRQHEAENAYRQAIALAPKDALPWNNLGYLLAEHLGRLIEAKEAYRRAIKLDATESYPVYNLALLLAQGGQTSEANITYRQAAELAQVQDASENSGIEYVQILLQAHLYLGNRDLAMQALQRLAQAAAIGNQLAFFRLKEQARECHTIGLGPALQDLMEQSAWAEFLQPFSLALAAASQGDRQILAGAPAEVRSLAEEVLAELVRRPAQSEPSGTAKDVAENNFLRQARG